MNTICATLSAGLVVLLLSITAVHAADRDVIENSDFTKTVSIVFNGTFASVTNGAGVTVGYGTNGSHITITSAAEGVEYILSGSSADGFVQITSTHASKVRLNGVSLTSTNGPAISMVSAARNFIVTTAGTNNALADGASYTRTGSGALNATGPLILAGKGTLAVEGRKSHAIYGGSYIRALGGDVNVTSAVKDAIHSKTYFQMDRGTLALAATGDGIDGDSGYILINGGSISIRSTVDDTKGITCDGAITVNGGVINMTIAGIQSKGITCKSNLTVNRGVVSLNLSGGVFLETVTPTTGSAYVDPSYCTGMKCDGNLSVNGGTITITHTGTAGRGMSADGSISIAAGVVDIATTGGASSSFTDDTGAADTASADCIKADGTLTISGGAVTARSTGTGGDCISADLALAVSGGTLSLVTEGASGDGLISKQGVTINGGTLNFTGKGAQSKGIKSETAMAINGGTLMFAMSGAVVLENVTSTTYNPSYCSAIKCDASLSITSGTISINHTGQAGKGISADGDIAISGGSITITTSGANTASFRNASNVLDMAAADCLKTDGNLTITGGTITATSAGAAADAISCDGVAVLGVLGNDASPVISANTTGAKVLLTGSDYVNAKAFKAGGNLTMNGGIFRATTQQDGGEGMESKANLTINGGVVEITSYDDCINATTKVTVNGGTIYCYSSGNDGIDSNGTFAYTGGTVISSGSNSPEEGFDCDSNNFAISGGILIGTGGATSNPTSASSTKRSFIYKNALASGTILQLKADGVTKMIYKIPRTYTGGGGGGGSTPMTMLVSMPDLATGVSYTLVSGGTVSGATDFHGYYPLTATITGTTTTQKTFTLSTSSMLTTVP